jgi:hypothetical protein
LLLSYIRLILYIEFVQPMSKNGTWGTPKCYINKRSENWSAIAMRPARSPAPHGLSTALYIAGQAQAQKPGRPGEGSLLRAWVEWGGLSRIRPAWRPDLPWDHRWP